MKSFWSNSKNKIEIDKLLLEFNFEMETRRKERNGKWYLGLRPRQYFRLAFLCIFSRWRVILFMRLIIRGYSDSAAYKYATQWPREKAIQWEQSIITQKSYESNLGKN